MFVPGPRGYSSGIASVHRGRPRDGGLFVTSAYAVSVADVLARQHEQVLRLLDDAEQAPPGRHRSALSALVAYLALHEAAEHAYLHPFVLARGADPGVVAQRRAEEGRI